MDFGNKNVILYSTDIIDTWFHLLQKNPVVLTPDPELRTPYGFTGAPAREARVETG